MKLVNHTKEALKEESVKSSAHQFIWVPLLMPAWEAQVKLTPDSGILGQLAQT